MNELIEKSGVEIQKYYGLQSRYHNNVIYLNEYDAKNTMTIAHEFGHYLLDIDREDILEEYNKIKKIARENFTKSYISNDRIDTLKRTLNKEFSNEIEKQKKRTEENFNELITLCENRNDYSELFFMVQKALLNYNHIKGEYDKEKLDELALNILNSYSKGELINFLKQYLLDIETYGKTLLELSKKSDTKGLFMLSDLLSSIYDGEYYSYDLPANHTAEYYKKNPNDSFEEAFANFTSLKLNHCEKELETIKIVLGEEYYNFLEHYFQMKIQKINEKRR